MYELFMTAFINDVDFQSLLGLLSGYAWDDPKHRIWRVSHFAGANPNQPKPITKLSNIYGLPPEEDVFTWGLPNVDVLQNAPHNPIDPEWKELSDILKRQSYIVTTRHMVQKPKHFGAPEPIADNYFDANAGALFWTEIPDPASVAGGQALIMQRKKIELHDQLNLPTVLRDNDFVYRDEYVEESFDLYHRDDPVEFHIVRTYKVPHPPPSATTTTNNNNNNTATSAAGPSTTLPPLESLEPTIHGKWMLTVVSYVLDDNTPDRIQAARDALAKVRDDMEFIQFKEVDRKYYDTQLAASRRPASQALGMTQQLAGISGSAR